MLIAMTFNVGLFLAVITGLALGIFCFGHIVEKDYVFLSKTDNTAPLLGRVDDAGCCS